MRPSSNRVGSVASVRTEHDDEDDRRLAMMLIADKRLEALDTVEGYELIGLPGEMAHQPAPTRQPRQIDTSAGIKSFERLPKVTAEIAREILMAEASQRCCQSKRFLRDMHITKVENTLAWHYSLETYVESRFTCWTYEPFVGQKLDTQDSGKAPGPWEVEIRPNKLFVDQDKELIVPHTSAVKPCHHCSATGKTVCHKCRGKKVARCSDCSGQGRKTVAQGAVLRKVDCGECDGQGKRRCPLCSGSGEEICVTCSGHRQLVFAVKLKCEWRRKDADYIKERTDLPDELVRDVSGKVIFDEEGELLTPISNFPIPPVNRASKALIGAHENNLKGQRVLRQRHNLRGVPVTEVHYEHDGRQGVFFVYGFENKLFAHSLPSGSCCSLL